MKTYGALDLAFAALYAWVGFALVPGRSTAFNLALAGVCALLATGGVGLLAGARWGRGVALVASTALAALAAVIILGMVASAAYLRGIYGPLGKGMAVVAVVVAAVAVEVFALFPLFQLRFLLRERR